MQFEDTEALVRVEPHSKVKWLRLDNLILLAGCALLILPTMFDVATKTWSTEQGGHGPIVLVTGIWAIWRELKGHSANWRPGKAVIGIPLLVLFSVVFVLARITGVLEVEAFSMYATVVAGAYLLYGGAFLRTIWFPLVYLAFALPPPDTVVAAITQPVKIWISSWAVSLLYAIGYPVAQTGVIIQIGQYQLLVAAACAGLNSIVTLAALCLFYVYLTHRSSLTAFMLVALAALPVAIVSNFVRVLALVLVTYYLGDAAAQGFLHDFAGLLMFAVALVTIFAIDRVGTAFLSRAKLGARS